MRTSLVVLALGPLVVSSAFAFERARADAGRLGQARHLQTTAAVSFSLGRMRAELDLERTFMVGTVTLIETGASIELLAPVLGADPRDTVAVLVKVVDDAEPDVVARFHANDDDDAAIELARLLAPRRELLAHAAAGSATSADATKVYDDLASFLGDERANEARALDVSLPATAASRRFTTMLAVSDDLDEWSGAVAQQALSLTTLLGASGPTQGVRPKAGASMVAGDAALGRLQQSTYTDGTALAAGSTVVASWIAARDALARGAGMEAVADIVADPVQLLRVLGTFSSTTSELFAAGAPVYVAVDRDTASSAAALLRETERSLYTAIAIAAFVSLLALLWVMVLSRRITRPLVRVGRRAAEVGEGQLGDERIGPVGPREIATLAVAFDEVSDNLRLVERQTEALAAGRLDDDVLKERTPGRLGESVQRSIARVSDLTERLAEQARRDPMTGLPNRAAAIERLTEALHRKNRIGGSVAVLFIDLDGFKRINDAYGHRAGDMVLRMLAERFRGIVRAEELVARLGGDEFVVIAESMTDAPTAVALGLRLIAASEQTIDLDGTALGLSASVGVAITSGSPSPSDLLGQADQAVYQAKRDGKGRVCLFDAALQAAIVLRTALEADLRRALVEDEFDLYLQPVVDSVSGHVHGAEALLRWHRPGHGLTLPADFIPYAEESWLVVEIGLVVLDKAARLLARWAAEGKQLSLAVDVAGRHFTEGDLVRDVREALERHHVSGHLLTVGLTENDLVTDLDRAATVLTELRGLGVRVALNDFGTGHSSVNYLRQLPIDIIKIDRTYVEELVPVGDEHELLAALVNLAGSLHLDVVAEGVETAFQAEHLRAIGCAKLQGSLIAGPVPEKDFSAQDWSGNTPAAVGPAGGN